MDVSLDTDYRIKMQALQLHLMEEKKNNELKK